VTRLKAGRHFHLCLGCTISAALFPGSSAVAAEVPAAPRKSVDAFRTESPPVLDGRLDDAVWQEAPFVEDFHIVVSDEHG